MNASGVVSINDNKYYLKNDESFGLMDFGRGVLPFRHNWIWGNGSGIANGKYFGFNIGEFGNTINGSENIFFYDNKSYKMDKVNITFNKDNYMDDWSAWSNDKSFVFTMSPIYDNNTKTKVLWVDNCCHQVFGLFNGYIMVDGKRIDIKDFFAFIEYAKNRW